MKNGTPRKTINVDKPNRQTIYGFKELDNAVLRLSLYKNSIPFDVEGQTIRLGAKTSKGIIEQVDGFTINANELDIELKNSILVPGVVEIDLELKDANGIMTTASFFITVESRVLNDTAVQSTNEFDTFSKTVAKVEEDYNSLRRIIIDENQAANLQDQVNKTNAQLETNTKLLSKGGSYNYNGAVVTFIDDDGYLTFLERWKPLCDSKGIKICIGAITSKVGQTGRMTLDQLKALKLEGFEILNHTVSHPDTRTCTMEKWEQECVESKDYMLKNGLNDNQVIVYSKGFYGEYTEEQKTNIKNVTRKHFKYAVNSTGTNNPVIYDNMCLARREADNKSFDVLKQAVDTANADNTWLIILTHCNNAFKEDVLSQLIDYIQGLNIPILTFSEAEKIKGYDLYVGDYLDEDKKVILKSKDYVLPIKNELLINVEYQKPYDFDKSITEYELDKITYVAVDYRDDIHFSKGGVLETFRGRKNYSYQIYYMANVNLIAKRTWNETNSKWNDFIIINGIIRKNIAPAADIDVKNLNLIVMSSSSGITEINHFINGVEFQEVSILNKLSSITIKSNVSGTGEIRCKGGTDLVLAPNDMANFLNVGGIWYQK